MIAVDTSVWVAFFRGRPQGVAEGLRQLLDEDAVALPVPVLIEVLSGGSAATFPRLQRLLSALPLWRPSAATWKRVEAWVLQATATGSRFGVGDLLVAAIAAEHEAPVWSLERDFERLAAQGFIVLHG